MGARALATTLACLLSFAGASGAGRAASHPRFLVIGSYAPQGTAHATDAKDEQHNKKKKKKKAKTAKEASDPPRSTADSLPDVATGNQTHLIYFVPNDQPDQKLDTDGTLAHSVDTIRAWFVAQMGEEPRMDTLPAGSYDITFVQGSQAATGYTGQDAGFNAIRSELIAKGFNAPDKRYLVYAAVNQGNTCGAADYPLNDPSANPGHYAIVFLDSNQGCGSRQFGGGTIDSSGKADRIAAHEWLHNEGVVPMLAPHQCLDSQGHACTPLLWQIDSSLDPESVDLMFPLITGSLSTTVLDRDRDDYLDQPWPTRNVRESSWLQTPQAQPSPPPTASPSPSPSASPSTAP